MHYKTSIKLSDLFVFSNILKDYHSVIKVLSHDTNENRIYYLLEINNDKILEEFKNTFKLETNHTLIISETNGNYTEKSMQFK